MPVRAQTSTGSDRFPVIPGKRANTTKEAKLLAIAGTGYGLIGILVIILLVVLIFYFLRRA